MIPLSLHSSLIRGHVPVSFIHSTKLKFSSVNNKTFPKLISSGGNPNLRPPFLPLVDIIYSVFANLLITFFKWCVDMFNSSANLSTVPLSYGFLAKYINALKA